jgi:hypothetical protein
LEQTWHQGQEKRDFGELRNDFKEENWFSILGRPISFIGNVSRLISTAFKYIISLL